MTPNFKWDTIQGQIGERERRDLSVPFGKRNAKNFKTAGDVDKHLKNWHKKYAHLDKIAAMDNLTPEPKFDERMLRD